MTHGEPTETLEGQLRELRTRLARGEKLATLGGLTAGIAHEINNPIGFVKNNCLMLDEYLQSLQPVLRAALALAAEPECPETLRTAVAAASTGQSLALLLDDIEPLLRDTLEGVQQLEAIAAGLRRFARRDPPQDEEIDLDQCLRDALDVARNRLKYRAKVSLELDASPRVHGRPGDIRHIVLNLLLAAARTLPAFGEIRVRTDRAGGDARLEVVSNGPDLQPEELERLLTPELDSRSADADDWPGLTASHEMAASHGWRIEVTSAPGAGVTLGLCIPLAPESTDEHGD